MARPTAESPRISGVTATANVPMTDDLALYQRLKADAANDDAPLAGEIAHSLGVMRDAFRLYGPERVVSSFNGGKDAVAILHLSLAALAGYNEETGGDSRLRIIFFEMDDEFPEIETFLRETVAGSKIDMVTSSVGFVDGLRACMDDHGSAAFVLGTRESDPNAKGQQAFSPSSDWMPPFMRVNPILTWSYHDVWAFLRRYQLPYCHLYDDGYTSLGKVASTNRNPALRRPDGSYLPAWQLDDASLERAGRVSSKKPDATAAAAATTADSADGPPRLVCESAALLVVGDEILGGKQRDSNTHAAAQTLRRAGVRLERVCVVPDDMGSIVGELARLRTRFDVVVTSGGLGPTHDDITLKAVAQAMGMGMARSDAMAETITGKYAAMGKPLSAEVLEKMSTLPSGVRIRTVASDPNEWPILQCANVFVLPGVPTFFESKLAVICDDFLQARTPPVLSRCVRLAVAEESIVADLNAIVTAHSAVAFGSYPVSQGDVSTIITLEAPGNEKTALEAALTALLAVVPETAVVGVSDSASLSAPSAVVA